MNLEEKSMLELNISTYQNALAGAELALEIFLDRPENNVFDTLDAAEIAIEGKLENRAENACEGSYCHGEREYKQAFTVAGESYMATLTADYNRHDKKYYYIDETEFSVEKLGESA